jgi:amidohydrolase
MDLNKRVEAYKQYIIDMRRDFHMHPEVAFEENRTSQRLKEELEKMGIEAVPITKTGVVATIEGKNRDKMVALRSDIDALAVEEKNEHAYVSKNKGFMHACGHDAHMAMLLGAARVLNDMKSELNGSVRLIFQPAEETTSGAEGIIKEGGLEGVSNIFGIHIISMIPVGLASVEPGPRMASADLFEIEVIGKGGHGGMPHECIDPIVAGSAIVMNLQSVASRESSPIDPLVISVAQFHSGTAFNVLANTARLQGTVRCFNEGLRERIPGIIERIAGHTAEAYRATAEVQYIEGVPPTVNEERSTRRAQEAVAKIMGPDALISSPPMTGAEDFSLYVKEVPGTFLFLGAGNKKKDATYAHHNERFEIDEDALTTGSALHVQYALDYLNQ